VLNDLRKTLVDFFDELIDMFNEPDFVSIRILIKDRISSVQIAEYFIKNIMPHRNLIAQRDDSIFTEKNLLFSGIGPIQSDKFKKLWADGKLNNDDKQMIWSWLDTFCFLVEKYQKQL
jgi:hypothetical protein